MPSLATIHARLVKVKNVSAGVSERQALSNLIRFSRSRDPIMKCDSLSILMSPVDVGASLAGLEHCREVSLFPTVCCWPRSENLRRRLRSCVGMSKLLEWFLVFLATMASSHAEDRRLAKDGGEVRIQEVYAYYVGCEQDKSFNCVSRSSRWARWLAKPCQRLFCSSCHAAPQAARGIHRCGTELLWASAWLTAHDPRRDKRKTNVGQGQSRKAGFR